MALILGRFYKLHDTKMKFSIKDFFSKCDQETADLVTFTEEIVNGKLHFGGDSIIMSCPGGRWVYTFLVIHLDGKLGGE